MTSLLRPTNVAQDNPAAAGRLIDREFEIIDLLAAFQTLVAERGTLGASCD